MIGSQTDREKWKENINVWDKRNHHSDIIIDKTETSAAKRVQQSIEIAVFTDTQLKLYSRW